MNNLKLTLADHNWKLDCGIFSTLIYICTICQAEKHIAKINKNFSRLRLYNSKRKIMPAITSCNEMKFCNLL